VSFVTSHNPADWMQFFSMLVTGIFVNLGWS